MVRAAPRGEYGEAILIQIRHVATTVERRVTQGQQGVFGGQGRVGAFDRQLIGAHLAPDLEEMVKDFE